MVERGLTVFIPVYNEEPILAENTRAVLKYVEAFGIPHEVIIGSNGSTDRTPEIGASLAAADPRVVFFHIKQRGPGRAFAEAIRRARYEYFLCLDADLSFEMQFVDNALRELAGHDAVVGSKMLGKQQRSPMRIVASKMFIYLTRLLFRLPFQDYSIGAKAYRTERLRPFLPYVDAHTFYTQEMLYRINRARGRIIEIPVNCEDHRNSRFNLLHEGFYRYGRLLARWVRTLEE